VTISIRALSVLVLLSAAAGVTATQAVDIATLERSLTENGPQRTLATYFHCEHPEGYRLIGSGDPRAVALAVKLLDASDACDTEMLMSSLATAIQHNPEAVLPYLNTVLHGRAQHENFCIPFIAEETPKADALDVLDRSERALKNVSRPDLQDARRTCLAEIDKYRRALERAASG